MALDNPFGDGKTSSATAFRPCANLVRAPEPVEDMRQVVGGDANSVVNDANDSTLSIRGGYGNSLARGKFAGLIWRRPGIGPTDSAGPSDSNHRPSNLLANKSRL